MVISTIRSDVLSEYSFLVNTLMIGKPEKGRLVENVIVQMAQTGQIMSRLNEEELIGLLERVNQQFGSKQKTTVKVSCVVLLPPYGIPVK